MASSLWYAAKRSGWSEESASAFSAEWNSRFTAAHTARSAQRMTGAAMTES